MLLDLGLVAESERTPDMPLYTLRNKTTGEIKKVTDPGRALITGKWKHIGGFKGPILRGLAAARAALPQRLGQHAARRSGLLRPPL